MQCLVVQSWWHVGVKNWKLKQTQTSNSGRIKSIQLSWDSPLEFKTLSNAVIQQAPSQQTKAWAVFTACSLLFQTEFFNWFWTKLWGKFCNVKTAPRVARAIIWTLCSQQPTYNSSFIVSFKMLQEPISLPPPSYHTPRRQNHELVP